MNRSELTPQQQAELDKIEADVGNAARSFIGRPALPNVFAELEALLQTLTDGTASGQKRDNVSVRTMWATMTTMDKAKWWLATCCFRFIGNYVRKLHDTATNNFRQLEEMMQTTGEYRELDPPPDLPTWAQKDPHTALLCRMTITIPAPVNTIKLSIFPDALTKAAFDMERHFQPKAPCQ